MTATLAASCVGAACLLVIGLNALATLLAGLRLRRGTGRVGRDGTLPAGTEPVSIVRPVCGLEAFSERTLASGFRLDHPAYELVFCVAREADPVVPLVRRLMAAHPHVPARLLVGDDAVSDNPKLNNCVKGWNAARHDWVVLADSNVDMPPDYIRAFLSAWRPNTGLACAPPLGSEPDGFWAEVECGFLNTLQARWQYAAESLGMGFAQGKNMLWHKPFLERHGGIAALGAEIAEDAAATKLVQAGGRRVHLAAPPWPQPLGLRRPREVWNRQIRWARLRRVTFPLYFVPELVSSSLLPVLGLAWAAWALGGGVPLAGLAGVAGLAVWLGGEAALCRAAGWHWSWRMPLALLVRDILLVPMWAGAWVTSSIVWRGNAMEIGTKATQLRPEGA